jgi:group I intron endonuclease
MIGIYKITNPKGKIYIGQSKNIERRWEEYNKLRRCKNQIKLYNSLLLYTPNNHKFEIIEECNADQLDEREIYWGSYYNVLTEAGLNLKLGNGRGKVSNETKLKISTANKGKAGKYERTNHIKALTGKANSIKIFQFERNGKLVQEWESIAKAELEFGKGIKDNLAKTTKSSHGFIWSYSNIFPGYNTLHGNNIKIIQKSKEKYIIKEWNSLSEIEKTLGYPTSNISSCCRGKQKSAYGYIWKYKEN